MSLVNRGKLDIKLGNYAVGSAPSLADPQLVARAQDYRRNTAGRMIPLEPSDILKRFPAGEYHVSLKVDGEFSLLVYREGEALLVNPGGTVRVGIPAIDEAAALLKKAGVKSALIPGELHTAKAHGKRARVHDVSRIARTPATQAELDTLGFAAFDIVEIDGVPEGEEFRKTWDRLTALFQGGKRATVVETVWLTDADAIEKQFKKWVDVGAEGAVVRSDSVGRFKLKPRHTIDAVVIGFTESAEDDRKGMLHDLLLALIRPDGCLHVVGHVGGGFSNDDRRNFLSDLKDMVVGSDYVEVNDQVAYHMVRPEWVVEVSILDLIAQTTRGFPINKMSLTWDSAAKRYRIVRRVPLVGMISPQFVRRRDDKRPIAADIPLRQVTDLVEVPLADRDARQLDLPKSEVIRREVCTKQLKGQTMVRKLLMWRTNKDHDDESFPAYVIHYTDYSPNRKTPLEREIRVSSSVDQIEDLWKELATEAFTKGWAPVATASVTAVSPKPAAKSDPNPPPAAEPEVASPPAAASIAVVADAPKKRGKKAAEPAPAPAPAPTPEPETAAPAEKPKRAPRKKKTD